MIPPELLQQLGSGAIVACVLLFLLKWFMKEYLSIQQELIRTLTTVVRENSAAFIQHSAILRELTETIRNSEED